MNLKYRSLRLVRHFMPRLLAHWLLRYSLIIRPGFETRQPAERIDQYQTILARYGRTIQDQRILNFGYGGNFALACGLLDSGAKHITLLDKYALPDNHFNQSLLPKYDRYLEIVDGQVMPRSGEESEGFPHRFPQDITLQQADIHDIAAPCYDLILSSSVFEHLDDVDGITRSLARLTEPGGCQVHFIDLRDHYFKFPFEMLTYSESTWKNWLNPGSNLNRLRVNDYRYIFERYFEEVHLEVIERDLLSFEQTRSRIDPKFLTGDPAVDAVTLLQVFVCRPKLTFS